MRVVAANAAARRAGVIPGLRFTDAKARAPELAAEPIDRVADRAALKRLALWLVAWTPLVALDGDDGLMLETTGCDHLHGGEAALAAALQRRLNDAGIAARIGLAGTPGAASALARGAKGPGPHVLASGESEYRDDKRAKAPLSPRGRGAGGEGPQAIERGLAGGSHISTAPSPHAPLPRGERGVLDAAPRRHDREAGNTGASAFHAERAGLAALPVAALRLSEEAVALLRRFGLTRIGQLYGVDRKALARRFASREAAEAVMTRLDQALGLRREPLTPLRPPVVHAARLPCPEPLLTSEGIGAGLDQLTDNLCMRLAAHGVGARGFVLRAFRSDGTQEQVRVAASRPTRAPGHVLRLFRERLDRIDPGFGIDILLLEARRVGPLNESAAAFSGDLAACDTDAAALAALADRIAAKLGDDAVAVAAFHESHIPERAEQAVAFDGAPPAVFVAARVTGPRPLRLLARPEPVTVIAETPDAPPARFTWRRIARTVVRADGPERIAPEWWKLEEKGARARDYYRVEDAEGRRYWIFRQGLYDDGRGGPPTWFLHGLFP